MKHILTLQVLLIASGLFGQSVSSEQYASGFEILVDIDFDLSGNMYVVEKRGRIQTIAPDGTKGPEPLLDITNQVNSAANERGLLGMTLHPDWENNGFLYVHYTKSGGTSVISRFTRGMATTIDPATEDIILEVDQPFSNHNAGALHFGPDGYLYIGMGDGGNGGDPGNRSQNAMLLLGKMLRIDVSGLSGYTVPSDNPFATAQDTLPEIWAMGVRNPWKFSFDIETGDMYIADVGQNKWEEIDFQPATSNGGENYGWRCYEGFETFNTAGCGDISLYTPPIHVYENDDVNVGCSITGGYVYRGDSIDYLSGKYIYGDYCTGKLWALQKNECGDWLNEEILQVLPNELSTFGQDADGNVYYGLIGEGSIHKLTELCTLTASYTASNPACAGGPSGSIDVQVLGGLGMVTFDIPGDDFDDLPAGEYPFTVMDEQGCTAHFCTTLTDPVELQYPEVDPQLITVCEDENVVIDFNIFFEEFPDLTKMLYRNNDLVDPNWNGTLEVQVTGTYSIQFSEGDCSSPVQELVQIFFSFIPSLEITFENEMLTATDGFSEYQWFGNGILLEGETDRLLSNFELAVDYKVEARTFDGCLAISEIFSIVDTKDEWLQNVTISPNPTASFINVVGNVKSSTNVEIQLSTLNGRQVLYSTTVNPSAINLSIDASDFASGTYLLSISNETQNTSKKIIKY